MKLEAIIESAKKPIVRNVRWSPAVINIQFPNGDVWEYVVYEDLWLKSILRKHKRNVGQIVAALKRLGVEAKKIN